MANQQAFRNINKKLPWGTPEEMTELELDLEEWGSCSRPVANQNVGCGMWKNCVTRKRLGDVGRRNQAFEIYKGGINEGNVITTLTDCIVLNSITKHTESSEGFIKIVAEEGEPFQYRGTKRELKKAPDGTSFSIDPRADIDAVVHAYPRPKDNPILAPVVRHVLAKMERRKEKIEARMDEKLGLDDEDANKKTAKSSTRSK